MTDSDVIGTATDSASLAAVLRQRKAQIGVADSVLEDLAGLSGGYVAKYLGPAPTKRVGGVVMGLLLNALGVKLQVVIDRDQTARMAQRWQPKDAAMVHVALMTIGQARPVVLSRAASRAAKARWKGVSPEERKAHSDMMNAARKQRLARKDKAA